MTYDLELLAELSKEEGFESVELLDSSVEIEVAPDTKLIFQNFDSDDCLIGFEGTPWHIHDDITFEQPQGRFIIMPYIDLITEIKQGTVLICELRNKGELKDRYLVHKSYVDEFKYMEPGDELRIIQCS